ncbi:MAG TPA: type II 3-dehydroquinate dehydratase [Gammaproteobacteria bacterium]
MPRILVIHGPNLNLLGRREPEVYGHTDLESINKQLLSIATKQNCQLDSFQSNAEHAMVDRIQQAVGENVGFIIINAAAYTHTSIALRDALRGVAIPFIEVHLSNVYARESFRHHSYLADDAVGIITGLGAQGYEFAVTAACRFLNSKK